MCAYGPKKRSLILSKKEERRGAGGEGRDEGQWIERGGRGGETLGTQTTLPSSFSSSHLPELPVVASIDILGERKKIPKKKSKSVCFFFEELKNLILHIAEQILCKGNEVVCFLSFFFYKSLPLRGMV